MRRVQLSIIIFLLMFAIRATVAAEAPFVVVLGVAQDAGVPQIGCESPFCQRAWKDASLRRRVASLALVDPAAKKRWLFDATPDFPAQFETLKEVTGDYSNGLAGIFLTHAHIGHYTGLMYLGRESMNAREIKVYAMPRMKSMLETNAPWSQLVGLKNIALEPLAENRGVELGDGLVIEAARVPHRDEFSETVGYWIGSGRKSLAYVPDIDKWQKWELPLDEVVRSNDYVLIDGTFYADGEIARPMSEVPHPFVTETMSLLKDLPPDERTKVFFIHFNHTNPLVQGDREKIREVEKNGFHIAFEGQRFSLR